MERSICGEEVKRLLLFLTTAQGGGSYQYEQSVLAAVINMPNDEFEKHYLYIDSSWRQQLPENANAEQVTSSQLVKRFIQSLLTFRFSIWLLRLLLAYIHPVARKIQQINPDLLLIPSQETSWSYLSRCRSLAVIHDLMHRHERHFPEVSSFARYLYRETHFQLMCKYAVGIMVDSECGKKQVCESYQTPAEKIFTLPFIAPAYMFLNSRSSSKFDLPPKYIFYPAQFWEHKNHLRLLEAIATLVHKLPDLHLVLAGSKRNSFLKVIKRIDELGLKARVHILGYVPDEEMRLLYNRACALVMPTFFGPTNIPPLEAFVAGCPVAISNIYGIPEQVKDAAILFDPCSVSEIADSIERLWTDEALCAQLAAKGSAIIGQWSTIEFNDRLLQIVSTFV